MRTIQFAKTIEISFWGNVEYETNELARRERDNLAKEYRAKGIKTMRWTLPNQMSKYSGLGQYDGRVGNVYKLVVERTWA